MSKRKSISKETKALLRQQVLNGKSKSQVARDLSITFRTVWNHTQDIHTQKVISKELKEKVRKEVISGKSKYQAAKDYNLSRSAVYRFTEDINGTSIGWAGIRGKTLDLLQEIVTKGYAYPPRGYVQQRYRTLRKYFPTIRRITIYGRTIFYLKGKEDEAARAFLDRVNKKIISYQELRQVTEVFGTDLNKSEKETFLRRKRKKISRKIRSLQDAKKSVLKEAQTNFDDFLRRFLPSEVLFPHQDNY
ncbi:MAG: hypothetical protein JW771_00555 [Candidatus Thermoplasmatota archaeon]|nr:hypothetical protein [Candidatus Thermoplasmatota archaeon]